jgi:hypothetical protein
VVSLPATSAQIHSTTRLIDISYLLRYHFLLGGSTGRFGRFHVDCLPVLIERVDAYVDTAIVTKVDVSLRSRVLDTIVFYFVEDEDEEFL